MKTIKCFIKTTTTLPLLFHSTETLDLHRITLPSITVVLISNSYSRWRYKSTVCCVRIVKKFYMFGKIYEMIFKLKTRDYN